MATQGALLKLVRPENNNGQGMSFSNDGYPGHDKQLGAIEEAHGLTGYALYFKLLEHIYYDNGYYFIWAGEQQALFPNSVNVDIDLCNTIIIDMVKVGLFDRQLFNKCRVLTSKSIQMRHFIAKRRIERALVEGEHLLVTDGDIEDAMEEQKKAIENTDKDKTHKEPFERFWKAYPARNGKKLERKETYKLYCKIKITELPLVDKAVKNYARSESAREGFARDPKRFFKNDFWRDWVGGRNGAGSGNSTSDFGEDSQFANIGRTVD